MNDASTGPEPEHVEPGEPSPGAPATPVRTTFGARTNRRTRRSTGLDRCRLCWRPITIEPQYLEEDPPHLYYRCPNCRYSFPIRQSDVAAADGDATGDRGA